MRIKKSWFLFFLFCLVQSCLAAPIGSEEFSKWDSFQGMYDQIYNDILVLDTTEICERVLQWPDFWDEEGELLFSLEDCESFANTGTLSSFSSTYLSARVDENYWIDIVTQRYNFEKDIWKKEYDLARKLSLSSLWNDGDGGGDVTPQKVTSPVDLVVKWNEIDKILFGVMAEYPTFSSFFESEEDIQNSWEAEPEEDAWLDQRADKKIPYGIAENHYEEGEESLAGGYAEQVKLFEEEMNTNSLIPGRATTQTFDMPFTGKPIPPSTGMHVDADATPAESPDEPLQMTILEQEPMGELEGAFAKFFREQSAAELRDAGEDGTRIDWLYRVFVTEPENAEESFLGEILSLLQLRRETRDQDIARLELLPLQQFNTVLETWSLVLDKWKKANEVFLTNDIK